MTGLDPKLWIGDSNTLDQPSDDDCREVFGKVDDDEGKLSSSHHDAI